MLRFSANLSWLFTELPFGERFAAAKQAGFQAVEFIAPYSLSLSEARQCIEEQQLQVSVFNFPAGDWAAGERGLAVLPDREAEFRASVDTALAYAHALGATQLHLMAGISDALNAELAEQSYLKRVDYAAEQLAAEGLTLLLEPINQRDMPGYFLSETDQAMRLIKQLNKPNVRLQFDLYHHQISRGDVSHYLQRLLPWIGHIQIASVPARQEPDEGELDYRHLFQRLQQLDYRGWIGCEYRPRFTTQAGLSWRERLL